MHRLFRYQLILSSVRNLFLRNGVEKGESWRKSLD